jgi:hypothetical protein
VIGHVLAGRGGEVQVMDLVEFTDRGSPFMAFDLR